MIFYKIKKMKKEKKKTLSKNATKQLMIFLKFQKIKIKYKIINQKKKIQKILLKKQKKSIVYAKKKRKKYKKKIWKRRRQVVTDVEAVLK